MENLRKSLLKLLSSDGRNGAHSWGGGGNFALCSDIECSAELNKNKPCGIGAPCWLTTSKKIAVVVFGVKLQNFQAFVPPMPISTSLTHGSFLLADTQAPIAPETLSSREHFTSTVALKAIRNSSLVSLENTLWKVCLNKEELKESPITI